MPPDSYRVGYRTREGRAHHCEATDYDAVWATLNFDLPVVRAAIASLLAD